MEVEDLVVEYVGWIHDKARCYYPDVNDADDLAGETIFKCLSYGHRFESGRSFKPWALTIMENTFKTQYARRRCVLFTGYGHGEDYLGEERSDQRAEINRILSVVRE